jgi:hypothetical protein
VVARFMLWMKEGIEACAVSHYCRRLQRECQRKQLSREIKAGYRSWSASEQL